MITLSFLDKKTLRYVFLLWVILSVFFLFFFKIQTAIAANEWYVSPTGSASGNGSITKPWDIGTALKQPTSVQPGDTIWLRGGRYFNNNSSFVSYLHGTASAPIYVRQYPNERASVDGGIFLNPPSAYTWYWGFEIYSSSLHRVTSWGNNSTCPIDPATGSKTSCENGSFPPDINIPAGFSVTQPPTSGGSGWMPGIKVINMVVHDTSSAIDLQSAATDSEVYGTIIYNNGWKGGDRSHGHGVYFQNIQGLKEMTDSIDFNDYDAGLQAAGTGNSVITNIHFTGNTVFNSGLSGGHRVYNVILYGGPSGKGNINFDSNYIYNDTSAPQGNTGYSSIGIWDSSNKDLVVTNNYWVGGEPALDLEMWNQLKFTGNTVYSETPYNGFSVKLPVNGTTNNYNFDNNRYFGRNVYKPFSDLDKNSTQSSQRPTGLEIFVRPNKYEPGRANITIFNWDKKQTVSVNISNIGLNIGDKFEIRDAQAFYTGTPVYTGTYYGQSVDLPMTGTVVDQPIGQGNVNTHTSPEFQVFVVLPQTGVSATPPLPTGSSDKTPPTVPTNLSTNIISPSQVDLTWSPSTDTGSGISGYYVYRNGIKVGTATDGTTYHDINLNAGTSYSYSVSVYDLVGNVSSQSQNISVSTPADSNPVTATGTTLLTNQVPEGYGRETTGNDELGMKFTTSSAGRITAIRFYKLALEGKGHTGRIWTTDGTRLASVSFSNETSSGWQEQTLPSPLYISANTTYIVTVDTKNMYYPYTRGGLTSKITNGLLSSIADGKNGVYQYVGNFPNKSYSSSNYFRDIIFSLTSSGNSSPAIRFGGQPTGNLDYTINSTKLSLQTDKNATCKYSSTSGTAYSNMTGVFTTTGGTTHSTTISLPQKGTTYYYYVRCLDTNGNVNADDYPISFSVSATPVTVPPSGGSIYQYYEAESATTIVSPMTIGQNSSASGGQYVYSGTANSGAITFNVNVPITGPYIIWARIYGPIASQDSYFVSVDGGQEDVYDAAENIWASVWQWTKVNGRGSGNVPLTLNPRLFNLSSGTHTITFRAREVGAAIDRILLTNDQSMSSPGVSVPTTITPGTNPPPVNTTVSDPVFSPNSGNFSDTVKVSLSTQTSGASIYYTTSGDNPTFTSTLYTNPFTLSTSATVKAKAFKTGMTDSNVVVAVFNQKISSPPPAQCEYPTPPVNCSYVQGPNFDSSTNCGLILSCSNPEPTPIPPVPAPTSVQPVASWSFDTSDTNGSNVLDTSGNNYTATSYNTSSVTGKKAQALSFNGSTSYLNAGQASKAELNQDLTISLWIKTNNTSRWESVISKYDLPGMESGYMLRVEPSGHLNLRIGGNNLTDHYNSGLRSISDVGNKVVNDGSWHHVAVVVKLGKNVSFYVDGILNSTQTVSSIAYKTSADFIIGKNLWSYYGTNFTGQIDELKIFTNALNEADIISLSQSSVGLLDSNIKMTANVIGAFDSLITEKNKEVIPNQSTQNTEPFITGNLSFGMISDEVENLQKFLINKGYLSAMLVPTQYFGPITRSAVRKFQCEQSIVCTGSEPTNGYGMVGKITRQKISEMK